MRERLENDSQKFLYFANGEFKQLQITKMDGLLRPVHRPDDRPGAAVDGRRGEEAVVVPS